MKPLLFFALILMANLGNSQVNECDCGFTSINLSEANLEEFFPPEIIQNNKIRKVSVMYTQHLPMDTILSRKNAKKSRVIYFDKYGYAMKEYNYFNEGNLYSNYLYHRDKLHKILIKEEYSTDDFAKLYSVNINARWRYIYDGDQLTKIEDIRTNYGKRKNPLYSNHIFLYDSLSRLVRDVFTNYKTNPIEILDLKIDYHNDTVRTLLSIGNQKRHEIETLLNDKGKKIQAVNYTYISEIKKKLGEEFYENDNIGLLQKKVLKGNLLRMQCQVEENDQPTYQNEFVRNNEKLIMEIKHNSPKGVCRFHFSYK